MYLCGAGMVCSVGLSADAVCAALRAGIARFDELAYWDSNSLPVVGAAIPGLSLDLQFGPRLAEMLAMALHDWLSGTSTLPLQKVPLLIGVAEPGRPGGVGDSSARSILMQVQKKLGSKFHPSLSPGDSQRAHGWL